MEKPIVYFTDFRCPMGTSQLSKLRKLCVAAGMCDIDMEGKFVAIKMHFGELGNLAFLRPNYAKVIADLCREKGGMPFLTDCNTLYPGSRKNALEHMDCANLNGFNTVTTGCQIIIGDGLRGTDDVEVPVVGGEYCKTARIGRAIMDADIIISLTHFKGHEITGFGGAIKNIGMAAAAAPARWISTRAASPLWMKAFAAVAIAARASAAAKRSPSRAAKPSSTRRNARAAGAASAHVPLTPYTTATTAPTSCSTARWPSTRRRYVTAAPASCGVGARHQPQLRLPWRQRRADFARYRHVRQF